MRSRNLHGYRSLHDSLCASCDLCAGKSTVRPLLSMLLAPRLNYRAMLFSLSTCHSQLSTKPRVAPSNFQQLLATHSNSLAGKTNDLRRPGLHVHFFSNSANSSRTAGKLHFSVFKVADGALFMFFKCNPDSQLRVLRQIHVMSGFSRRE